MENKLIVADPYQPIREVLPANCKLGFVFDFGTHDVPARQVIYFVERYKIRQALFDGKDLQEENSGVEAMMDDGLPQAEVYDGYEEDKKNKKKNKPTNHFITQGAEMFTNQFNPVTGTDTILLGLLNSTNPPRDTKVAIGLEVVFVRQGHKKEMIFDRKDWELGDGIIALLKDYPVMTNFRHEQELQLNPDNVEYVLTHLADILVEAPKSKQGQKIVASTWATLQHNLEVIVYHDTLAPLYQKVCQISRDYLMEYT
jgi:hypothetical protein